MHLQSLDCTHSAAACKAISARGEEFGHAAVLDRAEARALVYAERRSADWSEEYLAEQARRLSHARHHCDVYIQTDGLSEVEVLERALDFLKAFPLPVREGLGEGRLPIEKSTPSQPPAARGRG